MRSQRQDQRLKPVLDECEHGGGEKTFTLLESRLPVVMYRHMH